MRKSYKITLLFLLLSSSFFLQAQRNNVSIEANKYITTDSSLKLCVKKIIITGNKKTKTYVIEREIPYKEGDSIVIVKLTNELEQARALIYNTALFTEVFVLVTPIDAFNLTINVEVKERWYVFPVPQFKWVDRNFNEWVKTYNASLKRVNYGLKFVHYNLTGRKDQLRIFILNGYNRNISASYNAPYSNSKLTEGFSIATGYTQGRQISYKTSYNNKQLFFPNDSVLKVGKFINNIFNFNITYQKRRGYFNKEFFTISYLNQLIGDTITKLNPNYFNSSKLKQSFIDLTYTYQYSNVDNAGYTLKGVTSFISVLKRGFAFGKKTDMLSIEGSYNKYNSLGKGWYGSYNLYAKVKLPFNQPYINQAGLGYGNSFLRGLDEYVIDGVVTGFVRSTLRKKVISFKLPMPFKSKSHPTIPFTFFAKTFADAGYVFNKKQFDTYLNNRLLYTGGFGIDILMLYDVNLRLEYSFNQLGQNGLFLHTQSGF